VKKEVELEKIKRGYEYIRNDKKLKRERSKLVKIR
jgi:hypothetical protein